jgi:hypothetical protein
MVENGGQPGEKLAHGAVAGTGAGCCLDRVVDLFPGLSFSVEGDEYMVGFCEGC